MKLVLCKHSLTVHLTLVVVWPWSADRAIVNLPPSRKIWHNGPTGLGVAVGVMLTMTDTDTTIIDISKCLPSIIDQKGPWRKSVLKNSDYNGSSGTSIAIVVLANLPTFLGEQFEIDIFHVGWRMTGLKVSL